MTCSFDCKRTFGEFSKKKVNGHVIKIFDSIGSAGQSELEPIDLQTDGAGRWHRFFFFCLIFRPVDLPSCLSISATLTNNSCLFCVCLFSEQLPPRPAVTTAPPHHRFDSLLIVRTKSLMTYSGWSKWISVRSTKMNEFDLHSFKFISFIILIELEIDFKLLSYLRNNFNTNELFSVNLRWRLLKDEQLHV